MLFLKPNFLISAVKEEETITTYACFLVLCSSDASRYLVEALESVNASELDDIIEKVLDAVEKQPCK